MRKIKRFEWMILIFNIAYLILFTLLHFAKKNYEFLLYAGIIVFLLVLIIFIHKKFNFGKDVLIGLSIWGLLHLSGGYFIINNNVLYDY